MRDDVKKHYLSEHAEISNCLSSTISNAEQESMTDINDVMKGSSRKLLNCSVISPQKRNGSQKSGKESS